MKIDNNALVTLNVNNSILTIFVDFTNKLIGDSNIQFPIISEDEKSWKSFQNKELRIDYKIRGESLKQIESHLSEDWSKDDQHNRIMIQRGSVFEIIDDDGDYNCLALGIMFFSDEHNSWLLNMMTEFGNFATICDRELVIDNLIRDERCFEFLETKNYVAFTSDIGSYDHIGSFVSELISTGYYVR